MNCIAPAGFDRMTVLAGMMLLTGLFSVPSQGYGDPSAQCAEMLETTRLWIRATDPAAPAAEHEKMRAAVDETHAVCEAARQASPNDGRVLVNAAYAKFAIGDREARVRLVERAAEIGYPPALVMMARVLGAGDTVEKDVEGAWLMLLQALKSDHTSARIEAAMEFMPGGAGPENPKRTTKVLREMIDAGDSEAMVAYAMKVLDMQKAERGSSAAVEGLGLLERAADEHNDGTAMIYLSLLYNQGIIIERDPAKASTYAQKAIEAGHRRGYGTMGQIYQNQEDPAAAVHWFQRGADADDGFSQGMLGFMYSGGFGVKQDLEQAVYWWTRGRWNGDKMSAGYLQVHREQEAARAAWEKQQAENNAKPKSQ